MSRATQGAPGGAPGVAVEAATEGSYTAAGPFALATGSGKDATLALHRARAAGLDVRWALNLHDAETGRVAFHGTRVELVRAHARALDLEPVLHPFEPARYEDVFEAALDDLGERGAAGIVFGNVHLADVRAWYEARSQAAGLRHVEPLWGEAPSELAREVVELGYRALVVSVDLERGDPGWLGRELDSDLLDEIRAAGADPCGEHGEYHTFVFDGPLFGRPVRVEPGRTVEMKGHRLLDLEPAAAAPGAPVARAADEFSEEERAHLTREAGWRAVEDEDDRHP